MPTLPDSIVAVLVPFATLLQYRTWLKAQALLAGAILAPDQRSVAAALRVMGLSGDRNYARYHQALNRAAWSPLRVSQVLLRLLLRHRDQGDGPLVLAGDSGCAVLDLLHFCQSLREPVTFITRLRLDVALYVPAPPRQPGRMVRPRVKGARLPTLKRLPGQPGIVWVSTPVAWHDGSARTLEPASRTAVCYHCGKPPVPVRWVLIRDPQGELDTQALLCANPAVAPVQVVEWFVLRWQPEATYQEVRSRLGVETRRQWSHRATARTTPILMGLFSRVALAAHGSQEHRPIIQSAAAWYAKPAPTFAGAMALARRRLWTASQTFSMSSSGTDIEKVSATLYLRLIGSLAYAA